MITRLVEEMKFRISGARRAVTAVDPGVSGAVAWVGPNVVNVQRDFRSIFDIVEAVRYNMTHYGGVDSVIENVHAMPGQGVSSCFSFGAAFGAAQAALRALTAQTPDLVTPQSWQNWFRKELGIFRPQEFDARAIATALLPEHALFFKRKKDHNSADAVLIGVHWICTHSTSVPGDNLSPHRRD